MKKWFTLAAVLFLTGLFPMDVYAQEKTVVALGADLTPEQRAAVLDLMGITEKELAGYEVVTISNAQEHEYLDDYLNASVIGSKSLSSVLVEKGEVGSGVSVTTKNINFCTTGMYRNALLTAGVKDVRITVAAPAQTSGTAALIGAVKAYEKMEGTAISDTSLSNALDELITTGQLVEAAKDVSSDEIEKLIAYIKEKAAAGELETEDNILKAIKEGEEKFGVTLTKEQVQKIIGLMNKLKGMGLNSQYLIDQAEKLYDKYGAELVNHADEAISEVVNSAVSNVTDSFFQSIKDSVKGFFDGLFKK